MLCIYEMGTIILRRKTISGLVLTGGTLDAGCLVDTFEGLFNENRLDSSLIKYADIRREIFQRFAGRRKISRDCTR